MKGWDIGDDSLSAVRFGGFQNTTEIYDKPVAQAEHWHEEVKLPMTSYKVIYDYYVTRDNDDIISHRINYASDSGIPLGRILYGDFHVQHDMDAFIQSEFQLPDQCKRNNLLNCGEDNVKRWEAMHFKHDHALRNVQEADVSV